MDVARRAIYRLTGPHAEMRMSAAAAGLTAATNARAHFRAALAGWAALPACSPSARRSVAPPRPAFFFCPDPVVAGRVSLAGSVVDLTV